MRHAAPEEIVAFRDGESVDPEIDRHIRTCSFCRLKLGQARWVRANICSEGRKPDGPTPTRDEIGAYIDEALDTDEMVRVETHIRADTKLLALFDKLLKMSLELKNPLPDPKHVEELKAKLRGPQLLGRLRIFITDRFKQVFHPVRPGEEAHRRAMLSVADSGEILACREAPPSIDALLPLFCSSHAPAPPPPPGPSRPRVIDTGRWLIRAVTSGTVSETILELVIEEIKSGKPVPSIPVKLEPGWDDPILVLTNESGSVRLPLPEGESRLEIGEGPELALELSAEL